MSPANSESPLPPPPPPPPPPSLPLMGVRTRRARAVPWLLLLTSSANHQSINQSKSVNQSVSETVNPPTPSRPHSRSTPPLPPLTSIDDLRGVVVVAVLLLPPPPPPPIPPARCRRMCQEHPSSNQFVSQPQIPTPNPQQPTTHRWRLQPLQGQLRGGQRRLKPRPLRGGRVSPTAARGRAGRAIASPRQLSNLLRSVVCFTR